MAEELRIADRPTLRRPVLVTAFRGWNDGGQGASLAAGFLAKQWQAARFADIDPEDFFDFQVSRPHVSLVDGVTRRLDWPDNAFYHAAVPGTGSATDQALIERYGLQSSRYEGPTGIVGVLHDACRQTGLDSVSLWAAVPHYVSLAPSPRAALALCQRLGDLLGTTIDAAELEQAAESYSEQVSEAVAADPDTQAYVEQLEQRSDELGDELDLPSGDTIAAELTRYLREREEDDGRQGPSAQ